jgi:hypothetical protein
VREEQGFDPVTGREIDQVGPVEVGRQELGEAFAGGRVKVAASRAQ